jgi:hypothetical protein
MEIIPGVCNMVNNTCQLCGKPFESKRKRAHCSSYCRYTAYYIAHKEHKKAYHKKWVERNRDKVAAYQKEYQKLIKKYPA